MKGCSPKCFEIISDQCVSYTGKSYPEIGVEQGDSINQTLEKLASALVAIKAKVDACSYCNGEVSVPRTTNEIISSDTLTYSSVTETPSSARISVSTTPTSTSIPFRYSISSLPEGTVIDSKITIEGMKNSYPSQLVSTSGLSGGLELKPDNFPANLIAEVRVMTVEGEKKITSKIPINPSGQNIDVNMYSKNIGTADLNTQSQINTHFDKELASLRTSVNALTNLNIDGNNMSITEHLLDLQGKVKNLST